MSDPAPTAPQRATPLQCILLLAILAGAAGLRLWGAFFDLPYIFHPDEPQNVGAIQDMLANRDPNPHLFLYPSLPYYVNAAAALLFRALPAWLAGGSLQFPEPVSIAMGATFAPDAAAVALYRSMTICAGVLCVLLLYLAGQRARGVVAGLIAALLAAVSPLLVADCRHVTVDSYVVLFESCTILASLAIAAHGRRAAYVAAGIAIGATAASKYNGAVVCLMPLVAHLARHGSGLRQSAPLWICALCSIVAFACLSPYVLLDYRAALTVGYQFSMYSGRHQGMEGNAPLWYLGQLWSATGIAALLAAGELAFGWRRRGGAVLVLGTFALAYLAFISSFALRNERTLLPVLPCVLLLAAFGIVDLARAARSPLQRAAPGLRRVALGVLGAAAALLPLRGTVNDAIALTTPDSRSTARDWINRELPAGAVVAVESYAPFVDPARFRIVQAERAIDHPVQWYIDQHADYLVLSQGMFGRYFGNTRDYPREAAHYLQLIGAMQQVREFRDGGYLIVVLKVSREHP